MRIDFTKPDIDSLRKEHMLVDMHAHSAYSHDCSTPLDQIVARARKLGVHVALTDHNNISGVLAGMRLAPDVFFPAIEITTKEGKDVIPYFYSVGELTDFYDSVVKKYVVRKSSLRSSATKISMADLLDALSRENCLVTLPHPFAVRPRRSYAFFKHPERRKLLRHIHAFEAINQTMLHRQNLAAIGWATQFDKAMVAGSDAHSLSPIGTTFTVAQATDWESFLNDVRVRRVMLIGEEKPLRKQVLDATKNATRLIAQKASILKNGSFRRHG